MLLFQMHSESISNYIVVLETSVNRRKLIC